MNFLTQNLNRTTAFGITFVIFFAVVIMIFVNLSAFYKETAIGETQVFPERDLGERSPGE